MTRLLKLACIFLSVTTVGCAAIKPPNMLETAPRSDAELIYPDWGGEDVEEMAVAQTQTRYIQREVKTMAAMASPVRSPSGQKNVTDIQSLMNYMDQNGIGYNVVPGQHPVIKLSKRIHFRTGSAHVTDASQYWLTGLGQFLASKPNIKTVIDGHTDSTGSNTINDSLSDKRAMQVKMLLTRERVPPSNVYTRGYGKHMPSCSNLSKQGMACNRRVELMFITAY
ncbi:putative C-terminal domain of outer-membrane protein OmpA [Vibrio nigripulchritudo SOn1]|uniref:C-terminal domain of outer-membrane protein OmpA n=1 Tax=Vibrio nigripulchritudo SOn1 TaxID=1238450 RepID=A0AAV2VYL5_9VIBR|nr:OmpA family protein [Vibrio nigripulchritudo]CCO49853.1 putative C-terminal domain of outer-membrane protein OmpA [Vibrio nigripulchritudo SOn1]